jgi:hypothetical protein
VFFLLSKKKYLNKSHKLFRQPFEDLAVPPGHQWYFPVWHDQLVRRRAFKDHPISRVFCSNGTTLELI